MPKTHVVSLYQGFSTFFICVPLAYPKNFNYAPQAIIFLISVPPISQFAYPYALICVPWNFFAFLLELFAYPLWLKYPRLRNPGLYCLLN